MLKVVFATVLVSFFASIAIASEEPVLNHIRCTGDNGVYISDVAGLGEELPYGEKNVEAVWGFAKRMFRAKAEQGHNGATRIVLESPMEDYAVAVNLDEDSVEPQQVDGNLLVKTAVPQFPWALVTFVSCTIELN